MSWRDDIAQALQAFSTVAAVVHNPLPDDALKVEYLDAPHKPPSRLPSSSTAVYGFWGAGGWLKIGIAGAKSQARFCSEHYLGAPSTLAAALVRDPNMAAVPEFDRTDAGAWIRTATHRVNILVPSSQPRELLALLEAFLHLRLHPRYER